MPARMRATLLSTGSPRSRCSLAMTRNRSLMCRSGAYAPCAYPRICSNCASACFHILGFIASTAKQSSNLCRRERDTNTCGAMDPGLRRDDDKKRNVREKPVIPRLDRGTQVIKLVANATQIPAVQWIPACAGMTTKKET